MDGTNRHEAHGACAAAHASLCPHCHREVAARVVIFECCFCGAEIERKGNLRGRPPLTCSRRECRAKLKREHAAARRARIRLASATWPWTTDVCVKCCYPPDKCRCDGTHRRREVGG